MTEHPNNFASWVTHPSIHSSVHVAATYSSLVCDGSKVNFTAFVLSPSNFSVATLWGSPGTSTPSGRCNPVGVSSLYPEISSHSGMPKTLPKGGGWGHRSAELPSLRKHTEKVCSIQDVVWTECCMKWLTASRDGQSASVMVIIQRKVASHKG